MVRSRKAECTVQRSILFPGTAKLRRVLRTKQPKHNESEALPAAETAELELGQLSKFTSALRRAMEIFCKPAATGAAKAGNRNHQGEGISVPRMRAEMGSPWSVALLRHEDRLQNLSLFCLREWNFRHVRPG